MGRKSQPRPNLPDPDPARSSMFAGSSCSPKNTVHRSEAGHRRTWGTATRSWTVVEAAVGEGGGQRGSGRGRRRRWLRCGERRRRGRGAGEGAGQRRRAGREGDGGTCGALRLVRARRRFRPAAGGHIRPRGGERDLGFDPKFRGRCLFIHRRSFQMRCCFWPRDRDRTL